MTTIDNEHHDGHSDAAPGGYEGRRRPGELVFTLLLAAFSGVLLWEAYGISGFEALSSPGVIPMATSAIMLITVLIVLVRTLPLPRVTTETIAKDIFPPAVMIVTLLLVLYSIALEPLGFLPTSAIFMIAAVKILSRRSLLWAVTGSLVTLFIVWFVFRIIFSVLMPAGIVPEAEMIQFFRNLFHGAA
ncbi:tripartite tricarboxylate transporter TctB family protein [Frigidibacter sp. MR17.14]|uniref:tripartite tricarboxylate transporter TctB family protein n=1 Tax=Frigidibacter sp. MR17.14 TaxID=3126509 RepID=UPI003012E265